MTAIGYGFEKKKDNKLVKKIANKLAKMRLYSRKNYEKVHKLVYPLFDIIAKKFNITVDELKYLTPKEINSLFSGEPIDVKQKVKDRHNCAFIYFNKQFCLQESVIIKINESSNEEIKGQGTFPGKVKGSVKIIKTSKGINNLKKGQILVTRMTMPDMITKSIKKVSAIITDEGGITCHAAIISRELKIPCIIGTKIATKILKDGDLVEVNTDSGIVRKIEIVK